MFIAVLEKDCTPHYFINELNAQKYLTDHSDGGRFDLNIDLHSADLYNQSGVLVGYYFKPYIEDEDSNQK